MPRPAATGLQDVDVWRADGRVAVQRGAEGWSASLRWLNDRDDFELRLVAPLGSGTYRLAGNAERVELLLPDGRMYHAPDPETLMAEHLGWSMPLTGLRYWLRGLAAPEPAPSHETRDEAGLLRDLHQAGWRVSVLRRMSVGDFQMPTKLFMHYGDLKVRIVVAQWTLETL